MFLLKKTLSRILFPFPFCLEVLAIGLLLLWFTRKQKAGKALVALAGVLLLAFGNSLFSSLLLKPLERSTRPLYITPGAPVAGELKEAKFIVVLGRGSVSDSTRPLEMQLDDGSVARLVEGVRITKLLNCCKLIVSGGPDRKGAPLMAQAMAQLAQELGVDRQDILLDGQSRDTEEEARHISPLVGKQPFILVTEASHMPRALALFRKLGTRPIPDPTEFRTGDGQVFTVDQIFPSGGQLADSERAAYEYLGLVWEKLRGKI